MWDVMIFISSRILSFEFTIVPLQVGDVLSSAV